MTEDEVTVAAARDAVAAARATGDWEAESRALFALREALRDAGLQEEAEQAKEHAQRFTRKHLDRVKREQGEADARDAAQDAAAAGERGDRQAEARALTALGKALRVAGRPGEAEAAEARSRQIDLERAADGRLEPARRAAEAARAYGDLPSEAVALFVVGQALADLGRGDEAETVLAKAEQLTEEVVAVTERAVGRPGGAAEWLAGRVTQSELCTMLTGVGRDEAAKRVAERFARMPAAAVARAVDDSAQTAMQLAARARERGDRVGEARALTMLGSSLREARGREYETTFSYREAKRVLDEIDDETARDTAVRALAISAKWRRSELRDLPLWFTEVHVSSDVAGRFEYMGEARRASPTAGGRYYNPRDYMSSQPVPMPVEILVGFVALKMLGPFCEEFAKKLGESLGESTARAIGRLRLRRHREAGRAELDVLTDAAPPTTIVLPDDLTDEARLGIVELDVTAPGVVGATLNWHPGVGKWLPALPQDPDPATREGGEV